VGLVGVGLVGDGLVGDGLGLLGGGLVGLGDVEGRGVGDGDVRGARERDGEGDADFSVLAEDFVVGVLTGASTVDADPGGAAAAADGVTASAPMDRLVRVGRGVGVRTAAARGGAWWPRV